MYKLGALVTSTCITKVPILKSLKPQSIAAVKVHPVRSTSFFNRLSQEDLWRGTTSVSNAGKRKGRGKGSDRKAKRNLNAGQVIGVGKVRVQWPGLTTGVLHEDKLKEIKTLPEEEKKATVTSGILVKRKRKKHPLNRGWSGGLLKGTKLGPPDPVNDETFPNFESVALEIKTAFVQTALSGRKRRYFTIVGVGNGNGVFGFGAAKTIELLGSLSLAKKRAVKRLLTLDLIEKHSVNHDFFSQFGRTRVFVHKRPEGFGLHCHRLIKSICQLIGIENLYAKVEGPKLPINIIRAFVAGLLRQKTYQEIADDQKLHLVEFREEAFNFPLVLASPKECLSKSELKTSPVFEEYIMGGSLVLEKAKKVPFFMKLPGWNTHLKKTLYFRNHEKVKVDLLVKYGAYRSHLSHIYPECKSVGERKKKEES